MVAVKVDSTHSLICDEVPEAAPPGPPMPPPLMYQWTSPSATHCWNWARVGEGSLPLNPPIGITE